jgi:hypothetical protein
MATITEDQRRVVEDEKLVLEREFVRVNLDQVQYANEYRRDAELEQLLADIRLKNRQASTEFWKIGIAAIAAGAVLGGVIVRLWIGG